MKQPKGKDLVIIGAEVVVAKINGKGEITNLRIIGGRVEINSPRARRGKKG